MNPTKHWHWACLLLMVHSVLGDLEAPWEPHLGINVQLKANPSEVRIKQLRSIDSWPKGVQSERRRIISACPQPGVSPGMHTELWRNDPDQYCL